MQTDSYTKVVLSLILLCLVVLLAQGFSGAPGSADATGEELEAARSHYAVKVVQQRRGRPTLLRWDTTTGEVWGMNNLMGKGAYWEPLNREGPPEQEPSVEDLEPPVGDLEPPAEAPAAAGGGEVDAEAGEAGGRSD
jgi:hypothetical protein